jgi:hypothetical protein
MRFIFGNGTKCESAGGVLAQRSYNMDRMSSETAGPALTELLRLLRAGFHVHAIKLTFPVDSVSDNPSAEVALIKRDISRNIQSSDGDLVPVQALFETC